jgi:hypothetical protein
LFFNKEANPTSKDSSDAKYMVVKTGYTSAISGKDIYGSFIRTGQNRWTGVIIATMDDLTSRWKQTKDVYTMGALTFDSRDKALSFIEELHDILLPGECWNFEQEIEGKTKYPILESYIKNVYYKLVKDHLSLFDNPNKGKLVFSEDKRYLLFNSGLLNRFSTRHLYNRRGSKHQRWRVYSLQKSFGR